MLKQSLFKVKVYYLILSDYKDSIFYFDELKLKL